MLPPDDVAKQYELTSGVTRVHVASLGRDYDLTRLSLAQAAQVVAAGCTRLRRKPAAAKGRKTRPGDAAAPLKDAGPAVDAAGPAEGKT